MIEKKTLVWVEIQNFGFLKIIIMNGIFQSKYKLQVDLLDFHFGNKCMNYVRALFSNWNEGRCGFSLNF